MFTSPNKLQYLTFLNRRRVRQALVSVAIRRTHCVVDAEGLRTTSRSPNVPNAVILRQSCDHVSNKELRVRWLLLFAFYRQLVS